MDITDHRTFNSIEEECHYWKELAKLYRKEKVDCQKEFEVFTDESRQLEQELEATLIQNEKQIRDLSASITNLRNDNESLKQRLTSHERDASVYETKLNKLLSERDSLKSYIRELEQKNDDLERTNRVVSESVAGFETMLNQAYEKNALLEMEIDEKEQMQINLQRLMDEARDLKQELKIRNISLPSRHNTELIGDKSTISVTSSSLAKEQLMDATIMNNVSKLNVLNDSRNNNLSLNASMDKSTLSNITNNNSSLMEATTLLSTSSGNNASVSSSLKSLSDSPHKSSSVLKYDCTVNSNPIAASTRVSALNIVADLLKKLDNLEAKLRSWKHKSPAQKQFEASFNNNENSCSIIDTIDAIKK